MPDNSAAITAILGQLRTGAQRVEVDGQDVGFDLATLQQQLRDLLATDTSTTYNGRRLRPVAFQIDLSRF